MNIEPSITKIRKFFRLNKRLPNYRELADLFNFASKNAAYKLAGKLIDAGYIEKDAAGKLIPKKLFTAAVDAGFVRAGFPTPAENVMQDALTFDEYLITRPEATFLLTVTGDSMIDAGIHPGDIVLVERGRVAKTGNIVVACVDGEWTLKYYEKENGKPVLIPANPKYQKIYPRQSLEIGGVIVGVVRKYN